MTAPYITTELAEFTGDEGNKLSGTVYTRSDDVSDTEAHMPPVLLMHGGGQTRHSWQGTAQQLAAKGHRAITVDARGHGDSEWVASGNYTFEHYCRDLRTLVAQINDRWGSDGRPAVLVGASLGGISGMLAQLEGGRQPGSDLFSAIVLVDVTPSMAKSGVQKILGFMSQDMRDGFENVEKVAEAIATYMPDRKRPDSLGGLRKNLRQRDNGRWYWHWDPALVDGKNNITTGRDERRESLLKAVSKIEVPTLLVRGGKSELVTEEAAQEFLQLVPHAKYVDVSDAGHMVAGDKNDVFSSAVIDFLEDELSR